MAYKHTGSIASSDCNCYEYACKRIGCSDRCKGILTDETPYNH